MYKINAKYQPVRGSGTGSTPALWQPIVARRWGYFLGIKGEALRRVKNGPNNAYLQNFYKYGKSIGYMSVPAIFYIMAQNPYKASHCSKSVQICAEF